MQPGELISPNATIYEIPREEWTLDYNQSAALARFECEASRTWQVRRFKADAITWWSVERDNEAIIDLALSTALRKARETE